MIEDLWNSLQCTVVPLFGNHPEGVFYPVGSFQEVVGWLRNALGPLRSHCVLWDVIEGYPVPPSNCLVATVNGEEYWFGVAPVLDDKCLTMNVKTK